MQIIKNSWQNTFIELVKNANDKVYLSSPFIKENIAKLVVDNIKDNIDCKIITKFTISNIRGGGLDLEAMNYFNEAGFGIKNISNLHAKIFIFDDNVIITSANLTNWWFFSNLEYWVLFKNNINIENDFLNFYNDKNHNFVKSKNLLNIKESIDQLPPIDKQRRDKSPDENDIFLEDLTPITSILSKWNLIVFESINKIWKDIFKAEDIYHFRNLFNWITPENTIRRNLQELRDNWLLEFVKRWVYKKLWI